MKFFTVLTSVLFISMSALAQSFPQETAEAKEVVDKNEVEASYTYCLKGEFTCRTVNVLKDKVTGQASADFFENFFSVPRQVASTSYFLKNQCGSYRAYADDIFDGVVGITRKDMNNQALIVTFDHDRLPTVRGIYLKRLGTTKYVLADMTYTKTKCVINGTEYDSADPNYSKPDAINLVYKRIHAPRGSQD